LRTEVNYKLDLQDKKIDLQDQKFVEQNKKIAEQDKKYDYMTNLAYNTFNTFVNPDKALQPA